jgi:hypothetical protein
VGRLKPKSMGSSNSIVSERRCKAGRSAGKYTARARFI